MRLILEAKLGDDPLLKFLESPTSFAFVLVETMEPKNRINSTS